jgi:protein SCO1/2
MQDKRKTGWAVALISLLLLVAVGFPTLQSLIQQQGYHGRWLDVPAPDFKLTTSAGVTLGLEDFPNQTLLVYFGYLHCDGFCQNQWVTLFHVMQHLKNHPVKVILITMDPERDSEADLNTLSHNLGEGFVSIRGHSLAQVQTLANAYLAPFSKQGAWQENTYKIEHSGDVFMITPDKRIKLVYSGDKWRYDQLIDDYQKLMTLEEHK